MRRWLKRYQAEGIPRALSAYRAPATTQSQSTKFAVTLQRLAEETGLRFSIETVRRLLKESDIVLSRPQHTISSPDPEYEVKKRGLKPSATV